jgi:hypothetical protein
MAITVWMPGEVQLGAAAPVMAAGELPFTIRASGRAIAHAEVCTHRPGEKALVGPPSGVCPNESRLHSSLARLHSLAAQFVPLTSTVGGWSCRLLGRAGL